MLYLVLRLLAFVCYLFTVYNRGSLGYDKRVFKNWRFSKRLEKVLPNLIRPCQNAFVQGKSIYYAIRMIDDIVDYTKQLIGIYDGN